jgi:hypothetical protein
MGYDPPSSRDGIPARDRPEHGLEGAPGRVDQDPRRYQNATTTSCSLARRISEVQLLMTDYSNIPTWGDMQLIRSWIDAGCPVAHRNHDARACVLLLHKLMEGIPKHIPIYCWGDPEWKAEIERLRAAERRAPVQGDPRIKEGLPGNRPGTITWSEHLEAYADYAKRYGTSQSAERLAERGGFGYRELQYHLGRDPLTWIETS